jgi:hypothetical protein
MDRKIKLALAGGGTIARSQHIQARAASGDSTLPLRSAATHWWTARRPSPSSKAGS